MEVILRTCVVERGCGGESNEAMINNGRERSGYKAAFVRLEDVGIVLVIDCSLCGGGRGGEIVMVVGVLSVRDEV